MRRVLHVYLLVYFALVLGALAALQAGGVLQLVPSAWIAIGLLIAAGLGVLTAVTARGPRVTRE